MRPERPTGSHVRVRLAGLPAWVKITAALFAATLLAYGPALRAGFIWNDPDYVTAPALRSLSGLGKIWFDVGATEQFYPVLHTAFWVQHQLWGDAAAAYHVFNVLLHAGAACLLVAILRGLRLRGAVFAGLIFALHPIGVESVAWISEQKNTLSLVFYLAAALFYLRFDEARRRRDYAIASAMFALALLSKSVTATLPAALLVVIWWRRGRLEGSEDVRPLVPWFVGGAGFGLFTAWVEHHFIGAQGADFDLGLVERALLAGRVIWFYAAKIVWPAELIFIYPRWQISTAEWWQWLFPVAALAVLAVGWAWRRRSRGPLAAWLLFLGSLFPTLGFFNVYAFKFSFVADHWVYLPGIPLIVLIAAGLTRFADYVTADSGRARRAIGTLVPAALAVMTWRQCGGYRDIETFYRTILRDNAAAWLAHNNLGVHLVETGRAEAALPHFVETLRLRPAHAETQGNLGGALVKLGRFAEAAPHLEAALRSEELKRRSSYPELQANWATVRLQTGRAAEAIPVLEATVRARPEMAEAHNLLGLAHAATGRADDAQRSFETALRLRPDLAEAHLNLGRLFAQSNRSAEAADSFMAGLRQGVGPAAAHHDLAAVLLKLGRAADAVPHLETAARLRPEDLDVRANLGLALAHAGRFDEAMAQCQEVLRRSPEHAKARRFLADIHVARDAALRPK